MGEKKTKDKSIKTKVFHIFAVLFFLCPDGGIGRRAGLKHQWQQCCAGSIPAPGTESLDLSGLSSFSRCKSGANIYF